MTSTGHTAVLAIVRIAEQTYQISERWLGYESGTHQQTAIPETHRKWLDCCKLECKRLTSVNRQLAVIKETDSHLAGETDP